MLMEVTRLEEERVTEEKPRPRLLSGKSLNSEHYDQSQVFGCGFEISGGEVEQRVKSSIGGADGVGVCCVKGRRQHMEDAVIIHHDLFDIDLGSGNSSYDFYGVYDGHGGSAVSRRCAREMHRYFLRELSKSPQFSAEYLDEEEIEWVERDVDAETEHFRSGADIQSMAYSDESSAESESFWSENEELKRIIERTFKVTDERMEKEGQDSGSTAVVALVGKENIITANCGDSKAVLSRGRQVDPIVLTAEHRPHDHQERQRIENEGGLIAFWNGSNRVMGILAMTRAIGDHNLRPYIISEPEIEVTGLSDEEEFLIMATDGLWDIVSASEACKVVRQVFETPLRPFQQNPSSTSESSKVLESAHETKEKLAAFRLARIALKKGSTDNISCVVIDLQARRSQFSKS